MKHEVEEQYVTKMGSEMYVLRTAGSGFTVASPGALDNDRIQSAAIPKQAKAKNLRRVWGGIEGDEGVGKASSQCILQL